MYSNPALPVARCLSQPAGPVRPRSPLHIVAPSEGTPARPAALVSLNTLLNLDQDLQRRAYVNRCVSDGPSVFIRRPPVTDALSKLLRVVSSAFQPFRRNWTEFSIAKCPPTNVWGIDQQQRCILYTRLHYFNHYVPRTIKPGFSRATTRLAGWVRAFPEKTWIESGRVRTCLTSHGSGRIGSGRVGSGQGGSGGVPLSRVGPGRPGSI